MSRLILLTWLLGQTADSNWDYRMHGNLDDADLRCHGVAQVSAQVGSARPECISWRISSQQCTGNQDVDWLHEDERTGKICQSSTAWELKKDLPGRASCLPHVVTKDGKAISFSLACTWECQSAKEACAGQATYEFSAAAQPR